MIITCAPYRISFFGGGSDLPGFYRHSPGAVLSTTINRHIYISSHMFFDLANQVRVKYSRTETRDTPDKIEHPILRESLKKFDVPPGFEVSSIGDVAGGSGLGSSSAFTAALLLNLHAQYGRKVRPEDLAEETCDIEINRLHEPIGKQDQYAVCFGGLNIIRFAPDDRVTVEPVKSKLSMDEVLADNLLMFATGLPRAAGQVIAEQAENMKRAKTRDVLNRMVAMVEPAAEAVRVGNLETFAEMLDQSWQLKRQLASQVSNAEVDRLYTTGLAAGALGGKLLGAGGSGFLLFYCPPKNQVALRAAMAPCRELPFRFDPRGARVIFTSDDEVQHV